MPERTVAALYVQKGGARYGIQIGDDGGCFAAALAAVERWGGVLEHPRNSVAWQAFGLQWPVAGACTWARERARAPRCHSAIYCYRSPGPCRRCGLKMAVRVTTRPPNNS